MQTVREIIEYANTYSATGEYDETKSLKALNDVYNDVMRANAFLNPLLSFIFFIETAEDFPNFPSEKEVLLVYTNTFGEKIDNTCLKILQLYDLPAGKDIKQVSPSDLEARKTERINPYFSLFPASNSKPQFLYFYNYSGQLAAQVKAIKTWPLLSINSEGSEILLPKEFFYVLSDGLVSKQALEEGGFKDSYIVADLKRRYEAGKRELSAYFFNIALGE